MANELSIQVPVPESAQQVERTFQDVTKGYATKDPQPLGAYAALTGVFGAFVTGLIGATVLSGGKLPEKGPSVGDMLLLGVATHKLSRIVAKDRVSAWFRAPFVTYKGGAGDGEVEEDSRRTGDLREAVGDLVTCPYCMGVWIAVPMWFGMMIAPRLTKFVAGILVTVTTADFTHRAYLQAKKWGE